MLGGPVYDRVYAIDVPSDSVVLLALSGDPGTDFDMYLFDSSATSVYAMDGQVASSTSSSSDEAISYATSGGGRYYIDLNGASDVEGTFRLTVRVAADTTPPTALIRLEDGAAATTDFDGPGHARRNRRSVRRHGHAVQPGRQRVGELAPLHPGDAVEFPGGRWTARALGARP